MIAKTFNKKHHTKLQKNQITQGKSEPLAIESTKVIATLYSKARATPFVGLKLARNFSEKNTLFTNLRTTSKTLTFRPLYSKNVILAQT